MRDTTREKNQGRIFFPSFSRNFIFFNVDFIHEISTFFTNFQRKTGKENLKIFALSCVFSSRGLQPISELVSPERQKDVKENKSSYKAGGVHLPLADQVGDVLSVVGDSFHAAHKVSSPSCVWLCRDGKSSKTDLSTQNSVCVCVWGG